MRQYACMQYNTMVSQKHPQRSAEVVISAAGDWLSDRFMCLTSEPKTPFRFKSEELRRTIKQSRTVNILSDFTTSGAYRLQFLEQVSLSFPTQPRHVPS